MHRPRCPIDPFDSELRADPYPHYEALREAGPILWHDDGYWVSGRYREVAELLKDPNTHHWGGDPATQRSPQARAIVECMTLLAPSGSRQLRTATLDRLGRRGVEGLRGPLEAEARRLLSHLDHDSEVDLFEEFVHPFTFFAICHLLGIPEALVPELSRLVDRLPFPVLALVPLPSSHPEFTHLQGAFVDLFRRALETRRDSPGEDLLSDLWRAHGAGGTPGEQVPGEQVLGEQALVDMAIFMLYAGHHNIMHFFGNALLALLEHPEQLATLRDEPTLAANAADELLRFDSPVQFIQLVAATDLEVDGVVVPRGEEIFVGIGAANRDPREFENPDTLDLRRNAGRHLSFGLGAMRCLGAAAARLDAVVGLNALLERFPHFERGAEPLRWKADPRVLRGLESLPLQLGAAP